MHSLPQPDAVEGERRCSRAIIPDAAGCATGGRDKDGHAAGYAGTSSHSERSRVSPLLLGFLLLSSTVPGGLDATPAREAAAREAAGGNGGAGGNGMQMPGTQGTAESAERCCVAVCYGLITC